MENEELNEEQLNVLEVISKNAAVDASNMFGKWLKSDVTLHMKSIQAIPFVQLMEQNGGSSDEISVGLYMDLTEGLGGCLLFIFRENVAFEFLDILLRKEKGTTKHLGDLEKSALMETANIVGCAYLNSLRNGVQTKIEPSPPLLIHDLTQSIIDSISVQQAQFQNKALFIETEFDHKERSLDWSFFFLPTFRSLKEVL